MHGGVLFYPSFMITEQETHRWQRAFAEKSKQFRQIRTMTLEEKNSWNLQRRKNVEAQFRAEGFYEAEDPVEKSFTFQKVTNNFLHFWLVDTSKAAQPLYLWFKSQLKQDLDAPNSIYESPKRFPRDFPSCVMKNPSFQDALEENVLSDNIEQFYSDVYLELTPLQVQQLIMDTIKKNGIKHVEKFIDWQKNHYYDPRLHSADSRAKREKSMAIYDILALTYLDLIQMGFTQGDLNR